MAVNINQLPKVLSNPKHTIEPVWGQDAGNHGGRTDAGCIRGIKYSTHQLRRES